MQRIIATILIGVLLSLSQDRAFAEVASASVSPASVTVAASRSANVNLTWRVTASALNPTSMLTSSQQIVIASAGLDKTYGTIHRILSRTIAPGATAVISETVQIPRSVIEAMRRSNHSHFVILRYFSDPDLLTVNASVNLYLTGGSGSRLQIDRMVLSFDDDTLAKVVAKGERLKAQLDIQFSGRGMLRGVWEIATPASTPGQPVYTILKTVHQVLVGNRTQHFVTPYLPTKMGGFYLLRFRVTEPTTGYDPVTLRYQVIISGSPKKPPVNIKQLSPGDGALISKDTNFTWSGGSGIHSWKLEIYEKPDHRPVDQLPDLGSAPETDQVAEVSTPPLTGIILPGDTHETGLSELVWKHLQPGQGYRWRLRAMDSKGNLVGESPLIVFRTP